MRPKGSKDVVKRKTKTILGGTDERGLISDYENGYGIKQLISKYGVTKSFISNLFSRRNIKKRINFNHIKNWESVKNIKNLRDNICGIYAIYFVWKYNIKDYEANSKINNIKIYIGSSVNIKQRLLDHSKYLCDGTHYSSLLLKYFNDSEYTINYAIIERCDSDVIMQKEGAHQNRYNKSCLLNSWVSVNTNDVLPYLKKAITLKSYKNYSINKNGCWESKSIHKSGYARLSVIAPKDSGLGEKKRYFYVHRIAYWEKTGEYAELIRHKCGNSKCRNPDHLQKGNHRDNAIDKRGNFPEEFEKKWIEFNGDPLKLSKYFSDRWSANQKWKDTTISFSVYEWEKKLSLRTKYPEILDSNKNRRFSVKYQNKKKKKRTTKEV